MDSRPPLTLAEQYAAACDWWREAGVEEDFSDEAATWLSEPEARAQAPAPVTRTKKAALPAEPARPAMGGERSNWPASFDTFAGWWTNEPSLDEAPVATRVAPRGVAQAELMVLVGMPEADDRETLLSGPHGELVANMLRAMGIAGDKAYLASALPRHMPLADWQGLADAGLGAVLLHHLHLAAPRRLLVLGRDILPLIGLARSQNPQELALEGLSIQALASFSPEALLEIARLRGDLWRRWLDWTGE